MYFSTVNMNIYLQLNNFGGGYFELTTKQKQKQKHPFWGSKI